MGERDKKRKIMGNIKRMMKLKAMITKGRDKARRKQRQKDLDDYITKIIRQRGNITSNHTPNPFLVRDEIV